MGLGNGYNFILGPDLWSVCDYHWQVLKRYNKLTKSSVCGSFIEA